MPSAEQTIARPAQLPLWLLFPLFFVAIFLSHATLLRLPYFWDEGGYYIPAAWDFYRTGTLIPQTTVTNAHPPLPSIFLAAWWHLSGFVIVGTRTLICLVSAAALLAIFRLARNLAGTAIAVVTTVLTALYPVWFAQSTLAHADIFAAAFTLWALSFYLSNEPATNNTFPNHLWSATFFALAALSKETAIVTPVALTAWEGVLFLRARRSPELRRRHLFWLITLATSTLPLIAWYGFHYARTGFVFGNPEFLRYNATANLSIHRILLCLWHRFLHLTVHMNLVVPMLCTLAVVILPVKDTNPRHRISLPALQGIAVVLLSNWLAFSILGGALLTRYLLPLYPLILLVCISLWRRHLAQWWWLASLTAAAFLCGIWINPPYAFAPEDNLTYRDMIVLHQQAARVLSQRFPEATVLTAWPATSELSRPEIGYTRHPFRTFSVRNFSIEQMQKAAAEPGSFDTAFIFSTKWEPLQTQLNLAKQNEPADARYFDFHHDLRPAEAAALLHGEIVWQAHRHGEWAAILHFPRIVNAGLSRPTPPSVSLPH